MQKQSALKPLDVVTALQLTATPRASFSGLADAIGVSTGEAHNSVRRLALSSLLQPDSRVVVREVLIRFLAAGLPIAFPAIIGAEVQGVPTGSASPALMDRVANPVAYVWPDEDGRARGASLIPLFPRAAKLPEHNSPLYELLGLVDVLRVGGVRERKLAEEILRDRLGSSSA